MKKKTSAPIGVWKVKREIMRDQPTIQPTYRPTDQPTDRQADRRALGEVSLPISFPRKEESHFWMTCSYFPFFPGPCKDYVALTEKWRRITGNIARTFKIFYFITPVTCNMIYQLFFYRKRTFLDRRAVELWQKVQGKNRHNNFVCICTRVSFYTQVIKWERW